jgi:hypothetical protein
VLRPALLVLAAALILAACSPPAPTPGIEAGPPPSTSAAPATPTSSYGSAVRNERGNLPKAIGQPAGTFAPDNTTITLDFRVDAIRQNQECAAETYSEDPINGQFLALDVYAKTTPAYKVGQDDPQLLAAGYSWSVVTADGVRHTVDTDAAWACSPASRKNLDNLTPSVTVTGTVYLDTPADLTGGVVVLRSPASDGGWEWSIPT